MHAYDNQGIRLKRNDVIWVNGQRGRFLRIYESLAGQELIVVQMDNQLAKSHFPPDLLGITIR